MLFVRSGWTEQYHLKPAEERKRLALREPRGGKESLQRYAGVAQEEKVKDWLHDCYFATVAGDAPAFEAWPTHEGEVGARSASKGCRVECVGSKLTP